MSLRSGRSWCAAAALVSAACGGAAAPAPTTPPPPPITEPAAAAPLPWLVGSYAGTTAAGGAGTLDVVASEGALYAIWLGAGETRVWIVDEAEAKPTLWAFRDVTTVPAVVVLPALAGSEHVAVFGDGPALWTARRDADQALVLADASAAPPLVTHPLAPTAPAPAGALEAADRAFAVEVRDRGADGWAAWTAPAGAIYRPTGMIVGRDAVRDAMAKTLAAGALDWAPRASRLSADGTVGFTVGTFVFRDRAGSDVAHGSYVTIWQREAGGAWRVRFDTGRPRG